MNLLWVDLARKCELEQCWRSNRRRVNLNWRRRGNVPAPETLKLQIDLCANIRILSFEATSSWQASYVAGIPQ
jgi:hypothetical protein